MNYSDQTEVTTQQRSQLSIKISKTGAIDISGDSPNTIDAALYALNSQDYREKLKAELIKELSVKEGSLEKTIFGVCVASVLAVFVYVIVSAFVSSKPTQCVSHVSTQHSFSSDRVI